jgi:hypothetical protein
VVVEAAVRAETPAVAPSTELRAHSTERAVVVAVRANLAAAVQAATAHSAQLGSRS